MGFVKKVIRFFDKIEDAIRGTLSRIPLLYALVGGMGVVLFWRGVWHLMDYISFNLLGLEHATFTDGILSIVAGLFIMLSTGLFVSFFVGDSIIMLGLRGEKKMIEKTESEVKSEMEVLLETKKELERIESILDKNNK